MADELATSEGDRMVSVEEAGRVLSLSRTAVYQLMESGALRYARLTARTRRIPLAAIRELIASRTVKREA